MDNERMMILKMVQDGKISADEAAKLFEALDKNKENENSDQKDEVGAKQHGKFFRVRITDADCGKIRANIRIPLNIMDIGAKFGAHFAPQIDGIESEELMRAVRSGEVGKIIDVFDDEDGEHVEIFIE